MAKKQETPPNNDEKDLVQNQDPKPEEGTAPADTNPLPDPAEQAPQVDTPELESLSALSDRHRVPTWQQAALMRLMGWNEGKKVYDVDYTKALEALKGRRIGGGRME